MVITQPIHPTYQAVSPQVKLGKKLNKICMKQFKCIYKVCKKTVCLYRNHRLLLSILLFPGPVESYVQLVFCNG